MDQRGGIRQPILGLVVIGNDELQPQPACFFCFFQAGDAAIHGDDHGAARRLDLPQRFGYVTSPAAQR